MNLDEILDWLLKESRGFEFDYSSPVEWILVLAYIALAIGNWRRSDGSDASLRLWHLLANVIFAFAGWMAGLWSMIIANGLLFVLQIWRLGTGQLNRRRLTGKAGEDLNDQSPTSESFANLNDRITRLEIENRAH